MALLGQDGPVRRLFWLGIGTIAGAAGTVWTERKVKERLDALAPEHAVKVAAEKAEAPQPPSTPPSAGASASHL